MTMGWRMFARRPRGVTLAGGLLGGAMIVLIAVFGMTVVDTPGAHAGLSVAQSVEESLTCQCGCGLTIANCDNPKCEFAVPARHKIEAMAARGMTKVEIIAYFRKKYGEKILAEPTTHGFNLLAWTMPFAAVLCGGLVIMLVLGRWHGEPPSEPPPPTDTNPKDEQFPSEMRERLEREIKERI
jgi:cytochrome c-type biogenesis protein CcmH/NrfF